MFFQLRFHTPERRFQNFDTEKLSIGRGEDNDLVLPYSGVSRKHACIYYDNGDFFLTDLSSTTGTKCNSEEINSRSLKLSDSARIEIGEVSFTFSRTSEELPDDDLTFFLQQLKTASPEEMLKNLLIEIKNRLQAEKLVVFVRNRESGELIPGYSERGVIAQNELPLLQVSKSMVYRAFQDRCGLSVSTAGDTAVCPTKSMLAFNIRAVMAYPLEFSGECTGVIYVSAARGGFGSREEKIITRYTGLLSLLIYCLSLENKDQILLQQESGKNLEIAGISGLESFSDIQVDWVIPLDREVRVNASSVLGSCSPENWKSFSRTAPQGIYFDEETQSVRCRYDGIINVINGQAEYHKLLYHRGKFDSSQGKISFEGRVLIEGDVDNRHGISAENDIEIRGKVEKTSLLSSGGSITVEGYLIGSSEIVVRAMKKVSVDSPYNTVISCDGDCTVRKGIIGTVINSRSAVSVTVADKLRDCVISAGRKILFICPNRPKDFGYLELKVNVKEAVCGLLREKNAVSARYAAASEFCRKNRPVFEKLISGKQSVSALEPDRRKLIMEQISRFREALKTEAENLEKMKYYSSLIQEYREISPEIEVTGYLPEGTTVIINGCCMETGKIMENVILRENRGNIEIIEKRKTR